MTPHTLASAARRCAAVTAAHRLAQWVGEGRPITGKWVLRPADIPAAAAAIGITLPDRIRTAAAVPALHRPWTLALTVGFLRIVDGHVRPGAALVTWPDADDETALATWLSGLTTAFDPSLPDAEAGEATTLARVLLTHLAAHPPPSSAELFFRSRDELDALGADAAFWLLTDRSWRTAPACPLEPLVELGAVVDEKGEFGITPLGRWAVEQLRARVPRPITPDLCAADVVDRLVDVKERSRWDAARPWFRGRDALDAAHDLLLAATTPVQRVAVVDVVVLFDSPVDQVWAKVTDVAGLGPHARFHSGDDLSEQDAAWLAVEYAAVALDTVGPDEALSRLDEMVDGDGLDDMLRTVECAAHPTTPELAEALTAFLASNVIPTSRRVYQLKISLDRLGYPVWRRVLVSAATGLDVLHEVIQDVMGWKDDHHHVFYVGDRRYSDPYRSPDLDDEEPIRCVAAFAARERIRYVYDFGSSRHHTITHERTLDRGSDATYPVCTTGRGDAPVEDWFEGPETVAFDLDAINRRLGVDRR